jgi:raffinose/stachyose/melibiose transport system permease protein
VKKSNPLLLYLFMAPAVAVFAVFFVVPFLSGFYYSFTSWSGLGRAKFVGWRNFKEFFTNANAFAALWRTLWMAAVVVVIQNAVALLFAVILDRDVKGKGFYKVIFFIPTVMSSIVVGYMWSFLFDPMNGAFNRLFGAVGWTALSKVNFLGDPRLAPWAVIFTLVWQYFGYNMVIYIAGLTSVPQEIKEAGVIDGTSGWQSFRHVTFPLIAQSLTVNVLVSIIGALKVFDHIFIMTGGGPGRATESLTLLVYKEGFGASRWGYGTAASTILFFIVLVISLILLRYLRKREAY